MSERSSTPIDVAPAVRLAGVRRSFAGVHALDGIDCAIEPARLVALAGANGSGKSTMLRIVAGVIAPDAGTVDVFGATPRTSDAAFRTMTGYVGQDLALDGEITGAETLRLFYALRGLPHGERTRRIAAIVEELELGSFVERRVAGYSGGQRQRLHLAIETMHAPALLLLDEPTSSLDPSGRAALWRRLVAWRDGGHTLLVVTHDLADVQAHCDRIVLLSAGRIVADDAPSALVASHGRARTTIELARIPHDPASLRDALERAGGASGAGGGVRVEIHGAVITITRSVPLHGPEPALDALRALEIAVSRFEQHPPDLSSAFFELTGAVVAADRDASDDSRVAGRSGRGSGTGGGRGSNRGGPRGAS
ncbi:MAG TPA: ABC transporter ATP-binding protein [Candidatus Kapabacteria bacterium]|jgi:ABC-type multidrug transport system ATPase subunit|nr:ABC transporter ATP-binding protein [Candidatus Kapabacteria bacterium]